MISLELFQGYVGYSFDNPGEASAKNENKNILAEEFS